MPIKNFRYAWTSLRISLSPASSTAMVAHRKSFPTAVPSSICAENG